MAGLFGDLINQTAQKFGLDPNLLGRIVQIESGGNPQASTGSYHGLLQLSQPQFRAAGGTDIFDPQQNLDIGAGNIAREANQFRQTYGRDPSPTEIYLQHQQGVGGLAMHMANPDQPAWKSMYMTAEGQQKGPDWARRAISGNIPSDLRSQYPGVEDLTSRQFVDLWRRKVEGGGGPQYSGEDAPSLLGPAPARSGPMSQVVGVPYNASPSGQNAPAGVPASLAGLLGQALGIQPAAQPAAGLLGIPAQAPNLSPPSIQMPDFPDLPQRRPFQFIPPPVPRFRGF